MTAKRIVTVAAFNLAAVLVVVALASLAMWQLQRRAWKLDLIARVEARVHAVPTPAPGMDRWPDISAVADEYRRVTATGQWLDIPAALAKAVTDLGDGYWVMTPFARNDGTTVLVNRGFIPADKPASASWIIPAPVETVTGKLRLSEPGGAFLRTNDPASDRWFSRDVAMIGLSRSLPNIAPYFIDAEGSSAQGGFPVPGLTVVSFSNNHLVYALTWGALALMAALGAIFINLDFVRSRKFVPDA